MKKILVMGLLAVSVPLTAQEDTIKRTLEEVVITAGKFEMLKKEVVQRIDIVGRRDIAWMNPLNTADLLAATGNILVQKSQGGGGSPIIRGFESSRVLIEVDGLRLNNAIFRGGHLQNVLRLDNNILERVEILYGPSSAMHGSDALGGVMHFITRQPELNRVFGGNALVRYSTATSEKSVHADVNVGFKKVASLTSFSFSDYGDIVQGANRKDAWPTFGSRPFYVQRVDGKDSIFANPDPDRQVGTAYRQYDLLQKVLFRPNVNTTHILNFQYSNTGNVTRYDRLTETDNQGVPKYAEWYYGPEQRILAAWKLEKNLNRRIIDKMTLQVGWQNAQESRHSRKLNSSKMKSQIEEVNVLSFDIDGYKKLQLHEINGGFEVYLNDVVSTARNTNVNTLEVTPGDTRYPDGSNTMNTFALYGQDKISLVREKLFFTAGLRYSYTMLKSTFTGASSFAFPFTAAEQNSGALSGTGGLVWLPGEDTKLTAGVSTGFRTPNIDDMSKVVESVAGHLIIPNPDLKPEHTVNFEITAGQSFAGCARIGGGAYYTMIRDAIVTDVAQWEGQDSVLYNGTMSRVYSSRNKQQAFICGAYATLGTNLWYGFSLDGTVNYTYGRIVEEEGNTPLDHIPPLFGKIALQYKGDRLHGELWFAFNGEKDISDYLLNAEDNEIYATPDGMPAWNTLNIRLACQVWKYLNVQLACENILDTNYRVFASGVSAPGRNFRITLRTAF